MNIGLLLCDDVQTQLQPDHGNYPGMFQALLEQHNPTLKLTTYRALDGQLPENTTDCDGWIISGSRHSVNDPFPWISALEAFVKQLYIDGQTTVGICFGHQLMAKALGGTVVQSDKGWGIGISGNTLIKHHDWMQPSLNSLRVLVSHKEQIEHLPNAATVIAASDFCPYYMVTYSNHFLSIQGHPEFTKAFMEALIRSRKKGLPQSRFVEGIESLKQPVDSSVVGQWVLNYLDRAQ
ncbi:type 1 glutamine amidotransferase [Endozoicomonas euniceicola]|uniref:Type 1 glutamine amidotransferase n=1 Tax=Endozoicomonas euniceicola TaxID=1234143 RepID=A0ABY6GPD9_9GAMM|nr:type 1 glutamine amidotransferase [Endozoicomonas euniceicola]UYM14609.1 type 1 glutamine amidotransferase [Endozoicomonas euniceicola]